MATLSFNSTTIKNPITNLTSHTKIPLSKKLNYPPTHTKNLNFPPCFSISESSVSSAPLQPETGKSINGGMDEEEVDDDPTSELSYLDPETNPESIREWEVDLCSRPILKNAIVTICDELGLPLPEKIRFFRSQMQTIITRACNELGIKPIPSKRCLSLVLWLEERYETVYTRHPGFQKGSKPLLALDYPFPMELPENLYGEKWAFVQLPFSAVAEEASSLKTRFAFGATLDLDLLGIEVGEETLIPGLAVATSRAKPLAAWMNGLEVCSVEADTSRASVILSVGISTRYVYAKYKKTPVTTGEAEAWEAAKKASGG